MPRDGRPLARTGRPRRSEKPILPREAVRDVDAACASILRELRRRLAGWRNGRPIGSVRGGCAHVDPDQLPSRSGSRGELRGVAGTQASAGRAGEGVGVLTAAFPGVFSVNRLPSRALWKENADSRPQAPLWRLP